MNINSGIDRKINRRIEDGKTVRRASWNWETQAVAEDFRRIWVGLMKVYALI